MPLALRCALDRCATREGAIILTALFCILSDLFDYSSALVALVWQDVAICHIAVDKSGDGEGKAPKSYFERIVLGYSMNVLKTISHDCGMTFNMLLKRLTN